MDINEKDYLKLSKIISDEDIQNYIFGNLSESDKHKIELILLDSSLESDAVEGLTSIESKETLKEDLIEINRRIKERISRSEKLYPVKPIKIWRYNPLNIAVAAAVSVLLVVVVVLFFLKIDYFNKSKEQNNEKPVPRIGFKAYSSYLKNNVHCPLEASTNKINSSVYLNFVVNVDGKPSDFKFIHKIGFGCDEEALRLVKEGPSWLPGRKMNKVIIKNFTLKIDFNCEKSD